MTSDHSPGEAAGHDRARRGAAGDGDAAEDRPGDPACWLRRVCPACGSVADADPPVICPECHTQIPAF